MRCALSDIYDTDNEKNIGRLLAAKKLADCDITYMYNIYWTSWIQRSLMHPFVSLNKELVVTILLELKNF